MKNNNGSYSHILKYTSLFGGVQMLNILIGLIRNKLVAVLLGPLGMGIVALYTSTINFIVNTSNLGIHASRRLSRRATLVCLITRYTCSDTGRALRRYWA